MKKSFGYVGYYTKVLEDWIDTQPEAQEMYKRNLYWFICDKEKRPDPQEAIPENGHNIYALTAMHETLGSFDQKKKLLETLVNRQKIAILTVLQYGKQKTLELFSEQTSLDKKFLLDFAKVQPKPKNCRRYLIDKFRSGFDLENANNLSGAKSAMEISKFHAENGLLALYKAGRDEDAKPDERLIKEGQLKFAFSL